MLPEKTPERRKQTTLDSHVIQKQHSPPHNCVLKKKLPKERAETGTGWQDGGPRHSPGPKAPQTLRPLQQQHTPLPAGMRSCSHPPAKGDPAVSLFPGTPGQRLQDPWGVSGHEQGKRQGLDSMASQAAHRSGCCIKARGLSAQNRPLPPKGSFPLLHKGKVLTLCALPLSLDSTSPASEKEDQRRPAPVSVTRRAPSHLFTRPQTPPAQPSALKTSWSTPERRPHPAPPGSTGFPGPTGSSLLLKAPAGLTLPSTQGLLPHPPRGRHKMTLGATPRNTQLRELVEIKSTQTGTVVNT